MARVVTKLQFHERPLLEHSLRKILEQQPQFTQVGHIHQVSVVNDSDDHLACMIETESMFDEPSLTFECGAVKLDTESLTENLDGVGVSVQRPSDGGDQVLLLRKLLERFLNDRFAGAGTANHETQARLAGNELLRCHESPADEHNSSI